VAAAGLAQADEGYRLPQFRQVTPPLTPPQIESTGPFRLLADADFPPFSFASQQGAPTGLAVELALAACAEAKIDCEVQLLPYGELLQALANRAGDAVIAGPRLDEAALSAAIATRPYFRTLGRFAVQSGSPLTEASASALAGKRVAVVAGSLHAAWLSERFPGVAVTPFDNEAKAQEALRTGNVEALFGDNLHIIYWLAGGAAKGCCRPLDHAFADLSSFSRNIAFLARADRPDLRAALDYGLDAAQLSGATEKIFNRFIPLNPW
jgi:polar amino acid transport system substrate-binding protein